MISVKRDLIWDWVTETYYSIKLGHKRNLLLPNVAPLLLSIVTSTDGTYSVWTFNTQMNSPSAFLSDFTIEDENGALAFYGISMDDGSKIFFIYPVVPFTSDQVLTGSVASGNITSTAGTALAEVTDREIANNVVSGDFLTFEGEDEPLTFENEEEYLTFEEILT